MKTLCIAVIALTVAAPFASASAGHVNRAASQRQFVAHMAPAPAPAERGLFGAYEPGENSSTSVNWRRIGGF